MNNHTAKPNSLPNAAQDAGQWRHPVPSANNDNEIVGETDSVVLHAALRHFAKFGLNAAMVAKLNAEEAFFAGDRESYDWWLGICRNLDRRAARNLDAQLQKG